MAGTRAESQHRRRSDGKELFTRPPTNEFVYVHVDVLHDALGKDGRAWCCDDVHEGTLHNGSGDARVDGVSRSSHDISSTPVSKRTSKRGSTPSPIAPATRSLLIARAAGWP